MSRSDATFLEGSSYLGFANDSPMGRFSELFLASQLGFGGFRGHEINMDEVTLVIFYDDE